VTLECKASGNPVPQVSWVRSGWCRREYLAFGYATKIMIIYNVIFMLMYFHASIHMLVSWDTISMFNFISIRRRRRYVWGWKIIKMKGWQQISIDTPYGKSLLIVSTAPHKKTKSTRHAIN
jgi:hypothetical protein